MLMLFAYSTVEILGTFQDPYCSVGVFGASSINGSSS